MDLLLRIVEGIGIDGVVAFLLLLEEEVWFLDSLLLVGLAGL
jgi:hypothetical protein